MSVSEPGKIITPWAESGLKNTIPPAANPATGRAGFDQGFSAINMTAKEAGGIPPFGQDFNGIFYEVTNILRYIQAGGKPTYDAALAAAIGGYPSGAVLIGDDGVSVFQNAVAGNATDPNSGGDGWARPDLQIMELYRRSYAEAGYSVVGTFQAGFTYVNANDVGIDLAAGKGYTGPAGVVAAGTNPTSGGFFDRSGELYSNNGLTMAGRYSTLAAAVSAAILGTVQVNTGVTKAKDLVLFDVGLVGTGVGCKVMADTGAISALVLSGGVGDTDWQYKQLANMTVDGNNRASNAIEYGGPTNPTLAGRWHLDNVHATNAKIGILKRHGNIGNVYTALNVTKCDIGYSGQTGAAMPSGCDLFYGGEFSACDSAAMYYNSTPSDGGQIVLNGTVFEGNAGFGLFIKRFAGAYLPVVLNDVWLEQNATAASVTIDGASYTPKDIRIDGCTHVELNRTSIRNVEFNNSKVIFDGCLLNGSSQITFDKQCTLMARNMRILGGYYPFVIESVVLVPDMPGQLVPTWRAPTRVITDNNFGLYGAETFANASSYSFVGTHSITGKKVSDGLIYSTCCEVTVPAGAAISLANSAVNLPSSKWLVITLDIKCVSGDLSRAGVKFKISSPNKSVHNFNKIMEVGKWATVAVIIQTMEDLGTGQLELALHPDDGPATFRLSAMQAVRFDTPDEAHAFYNSREYRGAANVSPVMTYGTEAPTTGAWARGDQVINANPLTGQPKGWTCIFGGIPGTWVSQGNL